ncbi:MAG TPA: hypothetical protein VGF94_24625 [Kofleriaceae bacterium]|jgi:hypothetical protein
MTKSIFALVLAGMTGCVLPAGQNPNYGNGGGGYAGGGGGGGGPAASSSDPSGPPPATAPAGPQVVSVELHNDCANTVKLFLGEKPKFGSGTNTSLGSNTTTSYQMKPGDMIWIIDDGENGVSSTTIGGNSGSLRLRITSGCNGFES